MLPANLNNRLVTFREATSAMRFPSNDVNTAIWGWDCYLNEINWLKIQTIPRKEEEEFKEHLQKIMHGFSRRFQKGVWNRARACVILDNKKTQEWEYRHVRHV